jgi:hypothetical protein
LFIERFAGSMNSARILFPRPSAVEIEMPFKGEPRRHSIHAAIDAKPRWNVFLKSAIRASQVFEEQRAIAVEEMVNLRYSSGDDDVVINADLVA